jgi:hypothetical protein
MGMAKLAVRKILAFLALGMLLIVVAGGAWYFGRDLVRYAGAAEPRLSMTGLYSDFSSRTVANGVIEFAPQYVLWSDGAGKRRFIWLPEHSQIDTSDPDRWNFPQGTRLWKEFFRDGIVIETRMLLKTGPDPHDWDMAVYLWRRDGSDADKIAFDRQNASGTRHDVPGARLCVTCHGDGLERRPLGFTEVQLPWADEDLLSLSSLIASNRFTQPPTGPFVIPGDRVTRDALGYLNANCGACHYEGSTFVPREVGLRLNLTAGTMGSPAETLAYLSTLNQRPELAGLGAEFHIVPGHPEQSLLLRRMQVRGGAWQMPPHATEEVDAEGVAQISRWIEALPSNDRALPN